jgi:hypothetical protein
MMAVLFFSEEKASMPEPLVMVHVVGKDKIVLTGRIALMVLWLTEHQQEIEDTGQGEVHFYMSHSVIRPKLIRLDPEMKVAG